MRSRWPLLFPVRRLVAAVTALAFGLNAATPTMEHGCAMVHADAAPEPAATRHQAAHHHGAPADAGRPAHPQRCTCVGHSCCVAIALPAVHSTLVPMVVQARGELSLPLNEDHLPASPRHLLPYALGPPASIA